MYFQCYTLIFVKINENRTTHFFRRKADIIKTTTRVSVLRARGVKRDQTTNSFVGLIRTNYNCNVQFLKKKIILKKLSTQLFK